MGQTVDNVTIANQTVNTYSKDKVSDNVDTLSLLSSGEEKSNYIYNGAPSKQTRVNKTMDQFNDYLQSIQEKQSERVAEQSDEEKAEKEAEKEIRNNLSSEEIKQLSMMGIDMESVALKDIMGMVNTIRGKAHKEANQQLMAEIKAANGDTQGLVASGGSVKVAGTDVKIDDIGVNELAYLVKNELPISRENLYKAHFSGMKAVNGEADSEVLSNMQTQLDKIIEQSPYDGFTMEDAAFLLANDLPVNNDSIKTVVEFKNISGKSIEEVKVPETREELEKVEAEKLYDKVQSVSSDDVYEMTLMGKEVTIQAAYKYSMSKASLSYKSKTATSQTKNVNEKNVDEKNEIDAYNKTEIDNPDEKELAAVTAKLKMEEIRLSMTMEASLRMVKYDINVDIRDLSDVVSKLRSAERALMGEKLSGSGVTPTDENIDMLQETVKAVENIAQGDAAVLGEPVKLDNYSFTIRQLNLDVENVEQKAGIKVSRQFQAITESYEAVGTAPRSDMGDSLKKAFANIDDLLREQNIEVNEENVRAAKILGSNSLAINEDNISAVSHYDAQVNLLMDNFYPEAVMGLIKDGINPMDISIEELNLIISEKNYNEGVSEAADFAEYLRDIESKGEVTAEERESYIGLYRVMDKLAKSGDREAGFIFANNANLTIRNMISAMRSFKARGIDVGVNDSFGMLTEVHKKGKAMDAQIESAFENFKELPEEVLQFMKDNKIEENMVNAFATDKIINTSGGIYQMVSEVMSKLKWKDETKENLIDEETGRMAASMAGADEGLDIAAELGTENILETIAREGNLSLTYEDIRNQITEMMYSAGAAGNITSLDIQSIKMVSAGLNVMSSLSHNDRYQIPVETEEGVRVINLTMKNARATDDKSGDNIATAEIYTDTVRYGKLKSEFKLWRTEAGLVAANGYVISDSSEGNEALASDSDSFANIFANKVSRIADGDDMHITFGRINSVLVGEGVGALSRREICETTIEFVKCIANIME